MVLCKQRYDFFTQQKTTTMIFKKSRPLIKIDGLAKGLVPLATSYASKQLVRFSNFPYKSSNSNLGIYLI